MTAHDVKAEGAGAMTVFHTDKMLQGNAHGLTHPPTEDFLIRGLSPGNLVDGRTYLVFVSFNRGGPCSSALFSYNALTHIATLLESSDGYTDIRTGNQIMLKGRVVVVPHTTMLAEVRSRMYPTGDVVYPTDTGESWCPGP